MQIASVQEIRSARPVGLEAENLRLRTLIGDLLIRNQELRVEVANLHHVAQA